MVVFAVAFQLAAVPARADKVDDLSRALMQDPSYKVRVQAALILGKLKDRRAVPTLIRALKDDNETVRGVAATSLGAIGDPSAIGPLEDAARDGNDFVQSQARKALAMLQGGGPTGPRPGAKYYLAVGFQGGKGGNQVEVVREALIQELPKLPAVTLSTGAGGEPNERLLASKKLQGYIVDGSIQRLTAGGGQVECDIKAYVATYPGKSIKMMTQAGATVGIGSGPAQELSGKRDCLQAAAEAIRDDVGKFLRTLE